MPILHALLYKKYLSCFAEWLCILQFYHQCVSDAVSLYNYLHLILLLVFFLLAILCDHFMGL